MNDSHKHHLKRTYKTVSMEILLRTNISKSVKHIRATDAHDEQLYFINILKRALESRNIKMLQGHVFLLPCQTGGGYAAWQR